MIDLKLIKKNTAPQKQRIIVYGPIGIGKSTFASCAEKPIFILTEDGLGDIPAAYVPFGENQERKVAATFEEVLDALASLGEQEHEYKTVVIDSLDWLETLVWDKTCRRLNVVSIESLGYGKGYNETLTEWREFFEYANALRNYNDMTVIMIAHDSITRVEDPIHPAYDTHGLKLHKRASAKAEEWADIIGFAALRTIIKTEDLGFDKTRSRALTTGEHVLYLSGTPAYTAKNRCHAPDVIPLDYEEFEKYLPGYVAPVVEAAPEEKKPKEGKNNGRN